MTETGDSLRATLRDWNEDDRLYLWGGAASAVLSLILLPLLGLVAAYCGYKIYDERLVTAALITGAGGLGFLYWVYYLTTL